MSHQGTLADLRRLYHHVENGGKWDYATDNRRLSVAISTIEELSEGACRYNCTTARSNWQDGYRRAAMLADPNMRDTGVSLDMEAEEQWKERDSEPT